MDFLFLWMLRRWVLMFFLFVFIHLFIFSWLSLLFCINVRFRLFILFILLLYDLAVIYLEFFLVWLVWLTRNSLGLPLRRHIEYLKHRIIIKMLKIQRLQYNLTNNKIYKLFLQLDLIKKISKLLLRYSTLSISFSI